MLLVLIVVLPCRLGFRYCLLVMFVVVIVFVVVGLCCFVLGIADGVVL